MMTKGHYLFCAFILCFFSCAETPKQAEPSLQFIDNPTGEASSLPFLYADDADRILLSWVEPMDSSTVLKYSRLDGGKWTQAETITRGEDWFVNWADFPAIAENHGYLISHILKKSSAGTYSYDIKLNLKKEGGRQWKTDMALHTDGTPTEHGFMTTLPYKSGFFTAWLDGRNTVENKEGERGAMTVRAAEVAVDGLITNESELDARTCDCCQTTAAITNDGPVVLYRDRSDDEIRDISIVRNEAGQWTAPKRIHDDGWKIKGCPVNGPKAAALGNHLAVVWFTAANDAPMVNLAFSVDGGRKFDSPIRVDETNAMGRVDLLLLDKENAVVSWMETSGERALIKAIRIDRNGAKGPVRKIAELDASRRTGFPQMELAGDQIYFAWTDVTDEKVNVRTALVAKEYF